MENGSKSVDSDHKEGADIVHLANVETRWTGRGAHPLVARPVRPAPALSIVIPTFNETANVPVVVERVAAALAKADWEIIFVDDDSPDGTYSLAKELGELDGRVRCIRRVGRRGLAGAA